MSAIRDRPMARQGHVGEGYAPALDDQHPRLIPGVSARLVSRSLGSSSIRGGVASSASKSGRGSPCRWTSPPYQSMAVTWSVFVVPEMAAQRPVVVTCTGPARRPWTQRTA
jgi:hypothetical protein